MLDVAPSIISQPTLDRSFQPLHTESLPPTSTPSEYQHSEPFLESSASSSCTPSTADSKSDEASRKRFRNTLAARKYRQKRVDRITELEKALEDMTRERDTLKLQLARQEAETKLLREMFVAGSQ